MRTLRNALATMLIMAVLCFLIPGSALAQSAPEERHRASDTVAGQLVSLLREENTDTYFGELRLTIGSDTLYLDGVPRQMDVAPEIVNGRTMLPIRFVVEAAGCKVGWDAQNSAVTVDGPFGEKIRCVVGSDQMTVNGRTVTLDAAPYIRDSRTYVPVRAVVEALDLQIGWEAETSTVTVTSPYQTARLLIPSRETLDVSRLEYRPDTLFNDGAGVWIAQYGDPKTAIAARAELEALGYPAEPDLFFSAAQTADRGGAEGTLSWGASDGGFAAFLNAYAQRLSAAGRPLRVAVLDCGVESGHPLLAGRVVTGQDFSQGGALDFHGTHVAGTVLDCVGSAPVEILDVRVMDGMKGTSVAPIAEGIQYAVEHGADIINLSLNMSSYGRFHKTLDEKIRYAADCGVLVVNSAGNNGRDVENECPSHMDIPGLLVVSAGDRNHQRFSASNYGATVDLMAPGVDIVAAVPGGGTQSSTGTSMAAPHAAAAAALLDLATNRSLRPGELEALLRAAATSRGVWTDADQGCGFLDLSKAVGNPAVDQPGGTAPKNVMMSDVAPGSGGQFSWNIHVLGSRMSRNKVRTVTFLPTLAGAPATAWDVSEALDRSVLAWTEPAGGLLDLYIGAEGGVTAPVDCGGLFAGYTELTAIHFNGAFDTSGTLYMQQMFAYCEKLTDLDLSGFDTSNVRTMNAMFANCTALPAVDVSRFRTANVTSMSWMFGWCKSLAALDVSGFDTSNVTNLSWMFYDCGSLTGLDVSRFNTGRVTDMSYMFSGCEKVPVLDVSGFDTSNVTNMNSMFTHCRSVTALDVSGFDTSNVTDLMQTFHTCESITVLDVSGFDTSNVTSFQSTFAGLDNVSVLDVSGFDTSKAINTSWMFSGCGKLSRLDVSGFDTARVTDMSGMFQGCEGLKSLDLSSFDTSRVTDMNTMFHYCLGLTALDLSAFDTARVTRMDDMFSRCTALTALDLSGFDLGMVTSMKKMFADCENLTTLKMDLDSIGGAATEGMFDGCGKLKVSIPGDQPVNPPPSGPEPAYDLPAKGDLTEFIYSNLEMQGIGLDSVAAIDFRSSQSGMPSDAWDASGTYDGSVMAWTTPASGGMHDLHIAGTGRIRAPESMQYYFGMFPNVRSIRFNGALDTGRTRNMSGMFGSLSSLTELDLSGINTANVTDMSMMFSFCENLERLDVSGFNTANVTTMWDMFSGCMKLKSLDLKNFSTGKVTDMSQMFSGCLELTTLNVSGFDTGRVSDFSRMFNSCPVLERLDVSGFNTARATNMSGMFGFCENLERLDVSGFDTGRVTDMSGMFEYCAGLTALDVSGFNTANVANIDEMFAGCDGLKGKLDVSGFDLGSVVVGRDSFLP